MAVGSARHAHHAQALHDGRLCDRRVDAGEDTLAGASAIFSQAHLDSLERRGFILKLSFAVESGSRLDRNRAKCS